MALNNRLGLERIDRDDRLYSRDQLTGDEGDKREIGADSFNAGAEVSFLERQPRRTLDISRLLVDSEDEEDEDEQPWHAEPTPEAQPGPVRAARQNDEESTLAIGREVAISGGEIETCDTVIVAGRMEAKLNDARLLEVAQSGVFRGRAEVDHAWISGHFDGDLVVRDRLHISATGRVSGIVRYRLIEIESGGEICADAGVIAEDKR